jgi:endonuclease/exonuclease/phosphatase family metal-dependent hydrolase
VKRELVAGAVAGEHFDDGQVESVGFASQLADEKAWLPGKRRFNRGWLQVRFEHALLGPVSIFNTHVHAFPSNWRYRAQAARQLGLAVAEASDAGDLVFVGGDFNAAPYYADDSWIHPAAQGGGADDTGFENTISYAALLHYGGLADLAVRGWRHQPDRDVVVGRSAVNQPDFYDREVFASDGATMKEPFHACPEGMRRAPASCASHTPATFTATDCNGLYMKQYAGTEPPARLDHLLVADPDDRVHAVGASIVLTDPEAVDVGDCKVELSDHYGVLVDLYVAPPPDWRR